MNSVIHVFTVSIAGMLMFQLKRRNADMIKPKNKRPRAVSHEDLRTTSHDHSPIAQPSKLPFLVELNPGKNIC